MIIIERPYVSDFLKATLQKHQLPVVSTDIAREMLGEENEYNFIDPEEVVNAAKKEQPLHLYTPSENAIHWISNNLHHTSLPEKINHFKDKVAFRKLTEDMYPDFRYEALPYSELDQINPAELFFPMILKPSVGFFSMGVRRVNSIKEWPEAVSAIHAELDSLKNIYPNAVLDTSTFIAEEIIEGDEYAIDAYFDDEGQPVILGIMKHIFGSDADVSDRVYFTSGAVIEEMHDTFLSFIQQLGNRTNLKNFPLHTEVRVDNTGKMVPIEVNPLRFGGWCTSADLMYKAYGFNPYVYFCNKQKPDWKELVKKNPDKMFSIVILDKHAGMANIHIEGFDYQKLLSFFEKPLELRKVDHRKFPQFGFLFTETRTANFSELEYILKSDLKEFIMS